MTLLARWRADQLIFEDTGGTDSCENGDGLAAWGIFEGSQSGLLATQTTAGNRPIWNSDDGGYPSVSVTGSSVQRLNMPHSAAWALTSFSWLAVVRFTPAVVRHVWGRGASWLNAGAFISEISTGGLYTGLTFHTGYTTRASVVSKPSGVNADWIVLAGSADSACLKTYANEQSVSRVLQSQTVNFGTNPLTLFGDGSGSSSYHMTGASREFAFWDSALSEAEMQTEISAAMVRWGVTNTVAPPSSGGNPLLAFQHGCEVGRSGAL